MFAFAGCTVDTDLDPDANVDELHDEEVGSLQQLVKKGKAGAVNGDANYCNDPANLCALGEGDCDSTTQCSPGLMCAPNNGPKFGMPPDWDVCAGAHCANGVMDGDETAADCGGSCGVCSSCLGTPGTTNFCNGCLCTAGQGDCDSSTQCASGLVCGLNNGPRFSLPAAYDVCVPAHCTNRVLDAGSGETGVDVGGPCGVLPCGNGVLDSGEACDDGINDGVLCSSNCSVAPEVGVIRSDCHPGAAIITGLSGTACISFPGTGASFLSFSSPSVQVTLFSNGDCTGNSTTVTSDTNFCGASFDQGGGLNDTVQSALVARR